MYYKWILVQGDFILMLVLLKSLKKGAFGGRDIYSGVNDKFYKNSWKEFEELENIAKKYHSSDFYDVSLNRCGTSLRFWEKKTLD